MGPCLSQFGPIFEQKWVYLRLFEAILGQFWGILRPVAAISTDRRASVAAWSAPVGVRPYQGSFFAYFWGHFGVIVWSFFGHFWSDGHFLVTFWSLFGSLLGAILGLMALE